MITNKNKLNVVIVVLFLIIISVLVLNKNKESFTNLEYIKIKSGMQGDMGLLGPKGPNGSKGNTGKSFEINNDDQLYLGNHLKLGINDSVYSQETKQNDFTQLKLSKKIRRGGNKLKISLNDSDNDYYIYSESNKNTDFYLNNDKMYVDGNFQLTGNLDIRNNDVKMKFPNDIIPTGTIFPFCFLNASPFNLVNGFYSIYEDIPNAYYVLSFNSTTNRLENSTIFNLITPNQKFYLENVENNKYKIRCDGKYLKCDGTSLTLDSISNNPLENHFFINYDRITKKYTIQVAISEDAKFISIENSNITVSSTLTAFTILPTIPIGWEPCNGGSFQYRRNGVEVSIQKPDLTNKFIVHYDNINFPFQTNGGNVTASPLQVNNIPEHTHTMGTSGQHTHTYRMEDDDSHTHNIKLFDSVIADQTSGFTGLLRGELNKEGLSPEQIIPQILLLKQDKQLQEAGSHTHTVTIAPNDSHIHSFNAYGQRSPTSINLIPNSINLIYIIKTM
jgi:hypothetical protein